MELPAVDCLDLSLNNQPLDLVGTHNGRLWKVRCFPASPKRTSESNQVVRRASEAYKASRRGWFKFHAPVDLTALKCTQLIDVRIGLRYRCAGS